MKDIEIQKFLKLFFEKTNNKELIYRFAGSFALKVQGIEGIPKDIDIICDKFSFLEFKYLFEKDIIEEGRKKEIIGNYFLIKFNDFEIDFFCFDDEENAMFDKIYKITWKKFELPVIPLDETCKFYQLTGRFDKAQKIKNYLEKAKYDF